jgi:dTDP-4-amino-4,6-dideoxy-D-galactose acyltransferase
MSDSNSTPIQSAIQFLDWDTKQLGVSTARITLSDTLLNPAMLREILKNARDQGLNLIYLVIPSAEKEMINTAKNLGGILVDHKITYLIDLKTKAIDANKNTIETYTETLPSPELIALAFESGKYSRFRVDPNITEKQFEDIYRQWITNSVNHTVADDVLVIRDSDTKKILGMVTVGEKNQRGDIGLLAVDKDARGKNIGTKLVQAAQSYFTQKNYLQSQVVTQQDNIPACKLYEKCGYHIEKIEYFFHFWL